MSDATAGQRRSKRIKTQEDNNDRKSLKLQLATTGVCVGKFRGQNSNGLATFPDELLLEILSYFPAYETPNRDYTPFSSDVKAHDSRREILSALSMTCSNLRRFFFPYIWEYIESYEGLTFEGAVLERPDHPTQEKACVLQLLRQLEMVTVRTPSLAKHVKVINVVIVKYSEATVLPELARSMSLLPNLKTIKFVQPQYSRYSGARYGAERPAWKKAFQGLSFPSIRNAILAQPFFGLLKSTPNILSLQPTDHIMETLSNPCCLKFVQHPAALENYFMPPFCMDFDTTIFTGIRHLEVTFLGLRNFRSILSNLHQLDRLILNISLEEPLSALDEVISHFRKLQKTDSRTKYLILKYSIESDCLVAFLVLPADAEVKRVLQSAEEFEWTRNLVSP